MSNKEKISDAYKKFAEDLEDIEEESKEEKKRVLKKGVLEIEQKYKEEIKGTHAVDARIVKLRKEAGMPELIGVGDKVQRSRFKDKDKFDQFLAKEVLEVGIDESRQYGGVILFSSFCSLFKVKRPNWEAPPKEIKKALESLAVAGLIPKLHKLKNKSILITFKPAELEVDFLTVLNVASANGQTSKQEIMSLLGWQKERVELVLTSILEQEIATFDKKEELYYFPALRN